MNKVPLTSKGAEKLRQELDKLKRIDRPRIIEAIAEARAHGDLKENAEYHSAREQQSFIEGRIKDIEAKLSNAQIIEVSGINAKGRIIFGATVEVLAFDTNEQHVFQIVGEEEADSKNGLISITSPIARGLIGKSQGDMAKIQAPGGIREFEILAVRYE